MRYRGKVRGFTPSPGEIFEICNCTTVKCLENNTLQYIPYNCTPPEKFTCASGRPSNTVMDEKFCCKVEVCDCYCTGFGDPHYITFDGEYYSHQGNCTYLLVEEIRPNYDNFKIYIDNVHCDIRDRVSCPRSIIVSFESQVIELKNMETNGRVKLKVFVNSKEEHLPFKRFGMKVYSSGLNLILEIPEAEIEVTFNGVAFTIKLPYQKFGNNTQGQCGTCNNNRADDCLLPGGQLVDSCEVMADYWLVNDPNKAHCTPPTLLPTVPPSKPTVKPTGVPCTANSLFIQYIRHNVHPDIKNEPDMAVQYVTQRMEKAGAISGHGNHSFGETFVYNCQDCTCDEDTKTVTCVDHSCPVIPEPNCNDPGFVLSNETSVDNPCCTELICKPKDVCVLNSVEYQVGVPVPLDKCQTCVCSQEIDPKEKLHIINCVPVKCVETCEPPGETWSPAHDKCSVHSCIHIKDTFISTVANIVCPTFHPENCQPGTIQTAPDGCCKTSRAPNHNNRICSTWGNSHFKTFDGDVYQFNSTCDYNFASDCHNSLPEFSVHIQRADTEGKLLIESVVITIKDYIIFLTKDTAVVNEEKVSNAFYGPRLLLERSHSYTKLFTKMGLILMWNGEDALMVELDTQFQNQTCGLCGDYNGIQVYNEFISKAKKCPFNMIYEESRSPCLDTCFNQDASKLCKEHDMDGCFCPPGMVVDDLSNTGCIPATECKCSLHDTYFKPGEIVKQECEECLCNSGKWMCKNLPCSATCSVEGGTYITTFDGKSYTFHGNCYYILTKIPGDKGFTVLVELIPCGTQQLDACMKTMVLLPDNNSNNALSFEAGGRVFQNNAEIHLPYVTANIKIFKPSSFHIMIQTEAGLQIQLQLVPIMQIYIALDHSNKKKMEGLCGNYNDAQADDFKTFQGIVEGTAAYFANTWKVHSSCPDQKDHLEDPCAISVENEQYAEHWCSALRDEKGLFSKCHTMVDPQEYYKKCKYSTCSCEKSEDCLCASLSSYVRACMAKGITLEGWRKNVCVKYAESCPATKIFSYGIKRCQQTCRSLSMGSQACTMNFKPVDGCSCPEGFYQNDQGSCVPKAKCPCYHKGDWIEPGKTIMIQDESCICANGSLHCQVSARKIEESLCTAPMVYVNCSNAKVGTSGVECRRTCHKNDGICVSLCFTCYAVECQSGCVCPSGMIDDGRGNCVKEFQCPCIHNGAYYFNGAHIKVKCNTCVCQSGTWQCTTKKCPGTCTIYGGGHYITYDGLRYEFEGDCEYIATQETELKLGDGKVQLQPLEKEKNVTCKVHRIGIYYAVETDIGLTLLWDRRTTVYITLAPDYKGQVCGVCGNFDDNTKNDFTTRNQLIVASPMEFGNSWKVSSSCPNVDVDVDPCSVSAHRKNWAQIQCNIILDDVFKACHCMVDPVPYYEACVHDSCACDAGGDCECLCTAIAAYAAACNHVNMCINWRNEDLCRCFPQCPPDRPIFHEKNNTCVAYEKCGCVINGTYYNPGDKVPSDEPCQECMYNYHHHHHNRTHHNANHNNRIHDNSNHHNNRKYNNSTLHYN
ncbi:MUC2 protein, partial [Polypterus senegalus]